MNIEKLIQSIEKEREKAKVEIRSVDGMARLQKIAEQYQGEYKLIWSQELAEIIKNRPQKKTYKTGIGRLDDIIGGFREQQLITVSAHTKHGKTSFGIFLQEKMTELSPVMIPLEQSNEEIVEQRLDNGYTLPNFLSPEKLAAKVTVDWIEERIVEGIAKYNTKFVLIDHLGYIDDFGTGDKYKRENTAYRIGQVMKGLKNIAKQWNVVIVLLVHISQSNEQQPPSIEDIKNSSDIAQESDMVVMLWRKNFKKNKITIYEDETLVSVMANRRTGKNGNVGLKFNRDNGLYEEDNSWVDQMEAEARRQEETEQF
jgi:replicative DNA helicase